MEVLYESLSGYGVPPADKIARLLSREKPKYRLSKPKTKFNIKAMDNPSEFIQRKAGIPKDEIIPFDRVKAVRKALNRKKQEEARVRGQASVLVRDYDFREDEAEMQSQMEADIHKAAQRPEYWGLTKDDLTPVYGMKEGTNTINKDHIRYYITKDNIRFPPVQWKSAKSGRIFEALPEYIPPEDGRQRTRYRKLYFRDNDELDEGVLLNRYTMPVEDDLYDFGKSFLRKLESETGRVVGDEYVEEDDELLKRIQEVGTIEVDGSTKLVPIQRVSAYGPQKARALAAKREKGAK